LKGLLRRTHSGVTFNQHFDADGDTVYRHACALGCEGIVSKRLGSIYRSGRAVVWVKVENPASPAVKREAEELVPHITLNLPSGSFVKVTVAPSVLATVSNLMAQNRRGFYDRAGKSSTSFLHARRHVLGIENLRAAEEVKLPLTYPDLEHLVGEKNAPPGPKSP
jgi:hypothetical protein